MPYAKDYTWCPACVVVECDCGERPVLTRSGANRGLELFRLSPESGEEMLPVFSSAEAAYGFLRSGASGGGWCVREFFAGELVSVLSARR